MFCQEHQTAFFKKGKMKNYAHPIKDENGEDTGDWCNAPEEEAKPKQTDNMSKEDWADKDSKTRYSIEGQKAADLTTQLWIAGKLKDDDIRVEALQTWLAVAFTKNMPDKVEVVVDIKPKFGGEDVKALLNKAGVTQKQACEMINKTFKIPKKDSVMSMIEKLDKTQLKWFLDDITKRLEPKEELRPMEPEDIPF